MEAISLSILSNTLPDLLTGFSVIDGMVSPATLNQNLSSTFPYLNTIDLDLAGFKCTHAHSISFLSPCRIHWQPGIDSVVTVRSNINVLMGGWRYPDFVRGPLHSGSADFTSIFMARENKITETVQYNSNLNLVPLWCNCSWWDSPSSPCSSKFCSVLQMCHNINQSEYLEAINSYSLLRPQLACSVPEVSHQKRERAIIIFLEVV